MSNHTGSTIRQINACHYKTSLLFQFILSEFSEAFSEIKKIKLLCSGSVKTSNNEHSNLPFDGNIAEIKSSLEKLVGSPPSSSRIFPWNLNEGVLAKLKSYYALFLQNNESDGKEFIAMQHYADKIWQACLQSNELIYENAFDKSAFNTAIDKASDGMQRFSKLIMRILSQFCNDENVIFFIIKNHQMFDRLYGGRYIYKLLNRLYAKGLKEAEHLLVRKYTERGFDNVVKLITENISQIETAAS